MKNLLPILAVCLITLLTTQSTFAQKLNTDITTEEAEFKKGDVEIGVGVGLLSTFVSKNSKSRIIPLSMTVSYRIKQFISVGAYAGYSSTNGYQSDESIFDEVPTTSAVVRNDFYMVGGRLEGHFNRERTDFYGGAMVSYHVSDVQKLDPNIDRVEGIIIEEGKNGGWKYSGYVGMKYMMTKHFGLFGEIGFGASLINLGLTSKF